MSCVLHIKQCITLFSPACSSFNIPIPDVRIVNIDTFRCYSYIGRIGGRQTISIGFGCETKGTVIHEIFHALGREHEQNRPDRDGYVTINEANIQPG